ncbi:hypothetical protein AAMO2058_000185500 [Amorphochlora amoebiformis]
MGCVFGTSKSDTKETGTFGLGVKGILLYAKKCGLDGVLTVTTSTREDVVIHQSQLRLRHDSTPEILAMNEIEKKIKFSGTEVSINIQGDLKGSIPRVKKYFNAVSLLNLNIKFGVSIESGSGESMYKWTSDIRSNRTIFWSARHTIHSITSKYKIEDSRYVSVGHHNSRERVGGVVCILALVKDNVNKEKSSEGQKYTLLRLLRFVNNSPLYPTNSSCDILRSVPLMKLWESLGVQFFGSWMQSTDSASADYRVSSNFPEDYYIFMLLKLDGCKATYDGLTKTGLKLSQPLKKALEKAIKAATESLRESNPEFFPTKEQCRRNILDFNARKIASSIAGMHQDNATCQSFEGSKFISALETELQIHPDDSLEEVIFQRLSSSDHHSKRSENQQNSLSNCSENL